MSSVSSRRSLLPVVATAALTALLAAGLLIGSGLASIIGSGAPAGRSAPGSAPRPIVTSMTADPAPLTGGTTLQLQGTQLAGLTEVIVGGVRASIESTSSTTASVVVPPTESYAPGAAPIVARSGPVPVELPVAELVYEAQTPVDAQLQYAFAHWRDYNLEQYGDFNAWGGDCMNFVSQTLVARGWTPTEDWFNDAQEEWAPAFVHVPSFDEWLRAHPELGATTLTLDQRDQLKLGDIVLFDWEGDGSLDHAQVVSRITTLADGEITIQMVGHNLDSRYRDLDHALATQGQAGATAFFWSIP